MLPGFDNWKTDSFMDITEGFTSSQEKEHFTTDELERLNAIISEEDSYDEADFKDVKGSDKTKGKVPATTKPVVSSEEPADTITETEDMPSKVITPDYKAKKTVANPTKKAAESEAKKGKKPTPVPEPPTMEEEDEPSTESVKEGFSGSRTLLAGELKTILLAIVLIALQLFIRKFIYPMFKTHAYKKIIYYAIHGVIIYIILKVAGC